MKVDVTFAEKDCRFEPEFGEMQIIDTGSGGGYSAGYNAGYEEGKTDGRAEGYNSGHNAGYAEGYDTATGEIEPKLDDIIDIQESLLGEEIDEGADKLTTIAENEQRVYDAGYTAALDKFCPEFEESGEVVTVVPLKETPTTIVSHVSGSASGVTLEHCRQIFDKTNESEIYRAYIRESDKIWTYNSGSFSVRIPCKPNTTYYVHHKNSANIVFRVAYVNVEDAIGDVKADGSGLWTDISVYGVVSNSTNARITITTGADAKYLVVQLSAATFYESINTLVVTDGITETHVDFGKNVSGGSFNWNTGVLTDGSGNITQLTPQTVEVFDGMNSYHSSTGNTTVSGRTDPIALLEALTDTILLMGSDI